MLMKCAKFDRHPLQRFGSPLGNVSHTVDWVPRAPTFRSCKTKRKEKAWRVRPHMGNRNHTTSTWKIYTFQQRTSAKLMYHAQSTFLPWNDEKFAPFRNIASTVETCSHVQRKHTAVCNVNADKELIRNSPKILVQLRRWHLTFDNLNSRISKIPYKSKCHDMSPRKTLPFHSIKVTHAKYCIRACAEDHTFL